MEQIFIKRVIIDGQLVPKRAGSVGVKRGVKMRGVGAHLLQLDRISMSAVVGRSLDYWSILTVSEFVEMAKFSNFCVCQRAKKHEWSSAVLDR